LIGEVIYASISICKETQDIELRAISATGIDCNKGLSRMDPSSENIYMREVHDGEEEKEEEKEGRSKESIFR
jgi:hypothetical protein